MLIDKKLTEAQWDRKLKIQTGGREDSFADEHHNPYEPTPYSVLIRLAESGYIESGEKIVDYGCGKGRVGFFLNQVRNCQVTGLEYEESVFRKAVGNLEGCPYKEGVRFLCESAENFQVTDETGFYFFNPFSVELLRSVLRKIEDSYYENPRRIRLFFYYPSEEYVAFLMTQDIFMFEDEIECMDLFEGNNVREKILVFEAEAFGEYEGI